MKELEIILRKIALEKQWLWMLINLSDEELQLPRNLTRQNAIDESLDKISYLLKRAKKYK